jgi:hypothetical protein
LLWNLDSLSSDSHRVVTLALTLALRASQYYDANYNADGYSRLLFCGAGKAQAGLTVVPHCDTFIRQFAAATHFSVRHHPYGRGGFFATEFASRLES